MQDAALLFAHYFPWWAAPLALVFFETGNHYRRTGRRAKMMGFWFLSLVFIVATISYVVFDGFHNLVPALRNASKELGH